MFRVPTSASQATLPPFSRLPMVAHCKVQDKTDPTRRSRERDKLPAAAECEVSSSGIHNEEAGGERVEDAGARRVEDGEVESSRTDLAL